jgi:hypothetical protein
MGALVAERSVGKLWSSLSEGPLVIGFTLPSSRRFEGLATAVKKLLSGMGVETYLTFIRGSQVRLDALRLRRCHAVVLSAYAADGLRTRKEKVLLEMPEGSFVKGHKVYFRRKEREHERPLKVGIDRDSYDQAFLTEREFEDCGADFKPCTVMQIDRLLIEGSVDEAVWTIDDMEARPNPAIGERPLSDGLVRQIAGRDTKAVILARAGDVAVEAVIKAAVGVDQAVEIQRQVIEGMMVPEY